MQLVNGDGSKSYRKCINIDCTDLPTGVLRGKHPKGYEIQILHCDKHLDDAISTAVSQFAGIFFEGSFALPWLKKAQENELRSNIEQSGRNQKER